MAKLLHSLYPIFEAGTSISGLLDLRTVEPVSLILGPAWTGAGSSAISFFGSSDGISFGYISSSGGQLYRILPVNVSRLYILSTGWFKGINWLYVISGEGAVRVTQSALRITLLNCRDREDPDSRGS